MKKLLFILLVISGFLALPQKSLGQTTIQIQSFTDSLGSYCYSPAYVYFGAYAQTSGYASGSLFQIEINFGDGTDTVFSSQAWSNYVYVTAEHIYQFPGLYTTYIKITGSDQNFDDMTVVDQIYVTNSCSNISGKVYRDLNSNCIFDTGEQELMYIPVKLYNGANLVATSYTNYLGDYYFTGVNGQNYTVDIIDPYLLNFYGYSPSCSNQGSVNFTLSSNTVLDFTYDCNSNYDLAANSLIHFGAVPGQVRFFIPSVSLGSCLNINGTLEIILDPLQTYVSTTGTPPSLVSGNTLTWNFTGLNYSSMQSFVNSIGYIYTLTSVSANIGDTICHTINVYPTTNDINVANNSNTSCVNVTASFDPNMKEVFPAGTGPEGFIDPDLTMTYTVHFQNTGTAAAQNVFIMDTLDDDLDFSSLEIINASHSMNLYATPGGILKFDFPNIQLPDSNSNEALSHGHVTYKINQNPALQPGTEISNTAHIFFDYNDAVITNTTLNTIAAPENVREFSDNTFSVFPNPTNGLLQVKCSTETYKSFRVTDLAGKLICSGKLSESNSIDLSVIAEGVYFLTLNGENTVTKKIEILR